ncbi:MAG: phosphoglycerate dehydrogenase [Planctomycetes bacterium]|nr:phosphoglycerate dehydrogenase [Planctomycetota bacterium]
MGARILIADDLSKDCLAYLKSEGVEADFEPQIDAKSLAARACGYDGLLVRSRTQVTKEVLAAGGRLRVVGRAGVGVDNIDLEAATARGVLVMNTPDGNTISAAEHTVALLLAACRRLARATREMREGKWNRKVLGTEIFRKTVGIVGLGRIGREVGRRLTAFGARVIGFDPFTPAEVARAAGVEPATLDTVVSTADFLTIHTPLSPETRGMFNEQRLRGMKKGAILVNCARGGLVDEAALLRLLDEDHLAAAALDVYATEPLPEDSPLRRHEKLVCTPHLAATTVEAQEKVAVDVARQVVAFLSRGVIANAVNAISVDAELQEHIGPFLTVADRLGSLQAQLLSANVSRIDLELQGEIAGFDSRPIQAAFLAGFLRQVAEGPVNPVNALRLAQARGLVVNTSHVAKSKTFQSLVVATVSAGGQSRVVAGTVFGRTQPRLVRIDDYLFDALPEGWAVIFTNVDVPGVIGFVGSTLGAAGVNIGQMSLGRDAPGGRALSVIGVDSEPPDEALETIRRRDGFLWVKKVRF